jgi:hypothetical protein
MWSDIPEQKSSEVSSLESKKATIDDIINSINNFWKDMHPDYQKVFESGKNLSKLDYTDDASIIESFLKSINMFYKGEVLKSSLSPEQKEEEIKKLSLLDAQAEQFSGVLKILKKPVDKNLLSAYILGYNVNVYQRNKNN